MVHVPSSGVSKTTEELRNGNNSFVVDTIQHYFMFQYGGVDESLSIDPITKSILNVKFINSVDVSKLIGGIREGYGINIDAMGGGVYRYPPSGHQPATRSARSPSFLCVGS